MTPTVWWASDEVVSGLRVWRVGCVGGCPRFTYQWEAEPVPWWCAGCQPMVDELTAHSPHLVHWLTQLFAIRPPRERGSPLVPAVPPVSVTADRTRPDLTPVTPAGGFYRLD